MHERNTFCSENTKCKLLLRFISMQDCRVEEDRTISAAAVHGVSPLETFEAVEHPSELVNVDQPASCPPPERCIQQDGLM